MTLYSPHQAAARGTTPSPAEILSRLEHFGIRLGLDRIRRVVEQLGNPDRQFPSVLVAGTNGKGSTAALLASMLGAGGYRTGLYTSPHLEDPEERIRLNGRAIASAELTELLERVVATSERELGVPPTYFESLTAAALLYFSEVGVDVAVLEVGLGGRLDATNVVEPELAVITPISLDHQEQLGSTLDAIAREKAGIMRQGKPVVAWSRDDEARAALAGAAAAISAELLDGAQLALCEPVEPTPEGVQLCELITQRRRYTLPLNLSGAHQTENLSLAVLAAERLADEGWSGLRPSAIERGVAGCSWPGRLESVQAGSRLVLLDGAHNEAAAGALADHLRRHHAEYDLLYGSLRGKCVERILPRLAQAARSVTLTAPPGDRALSTEELPVLSHPHVLVSPGWREAFERAMTSDSQPLLVCGSFYLVGAVRQELRRRYGVPAPAVEVVTGAGPDP